MAFLAALMCPLACSRYGLTFAQLENRRATIISVCMQFAPAIPTPGTKVFASPYWIHEVKYDGFRLIFFRRGHIGGHM
jgi:ATP-dependent DNA ligase